MKQLIERLRQLEAAATPGPWNVAGIRSLTVQNMGVWAVSVNHPNGLWETIFVNGVCEEQAQLITEMRNALPVLLHELEQRDARVEALLDRLEKLEEKVLKLERVAKAAKHDLSWRTTVSAREVRDALAALEGAHSRQQAGSIPLNKKGDDND